MLSYSTLHEEASKRNLFFYIPIQTETNTNKKAKKYKNIKR